MTIHKTTTIARRVTIEGRTYQSLEEIPAEIREKYKVLMEMLAMDDDKDGVPDLLQDGPGYTVHEDSSPEVEVVTTTTRTVRVIKD